ncbi:MAG TPA: TonB-dependent receptor [Methylomirabilota bacterium]|nr:TonB-dependent receptor [Methylomirabilota bacterium]
MDEVSSIPSYVEGDIRVAWRPNEKWELALVGQNLFDSVHPEYAPGLGGGPFQIERSFYGKATFRF